MSDRVWREFRRTRVRIHIDDGVLDIAPAAIDVHGGFVPGATGTIHIVTAQNPMGLAAPVDTNAAANERLAAELASDPRLKVMSATGYGGGPIDEASTWSEEGFAVEGLSDDEALDLARRHRQRAIFAWRDAPGGFRLVACDGSADEPRGWTTTFLPRA